METDVNVTAVSVPQRDIPLPTTISAAARELLAAIPDVVGVAPPADDIAAWRVCIARANEAIDRLLAASLPPFPGTVTPRTLKAANLYEVVPNNMTRPQQALLYVHGGAYVFGGGELAMKAAQPYATRLSCQVFAIDYRKPPDHPFPAALEDTVEAYSYLVERFGAEKVALLGVSAGGGLAAAAILKARDEGLPLPGAALLLTPEADLTESGDTFETLLGIDAILKGRLTESIALYAAGYDLRSPYLSPVFGDFTHGFPPTYLQSGTRDLFLSNTVILHRALRRAGIEADLHVFEAMPHGGFRGAPEDREAICEQLKFIARHLRQR
jgi:acetyl esterase/lipase